MKTRVDIFMTVGILVFTLCLSAVTPAWSASVQLDDGFVAGITNLQIGTMFFDVDFLAGSFNDAFPNGQSDLTFTTLPEAQNASMAITSLLSFENLLPTQFKLDTGLIRPAFDVPYELFPAQAFVQHRVQFVHTINLGLGSGTTGVDSDITAPGESWVVFNKVGVVPEPSTILLLGTGLAGLAVWRRKKSKTK